MTDESVTGEGLTDSPTVPLVLATRNAHKVAELRRILADADLPIELLTVADFARRSRTSSRAA